MTAPRPDGLWVAALELRESAAFFDTLAALLFAGLFWVLGVAWAAYRAVGWVERIRLWAHGPIGVSSTETSTGLAGREIDSMGVN